MGRLTYSVTTYLHTVTGVSGMFIMHTHFYHNNATSYAVSILVSFLIILSAHFPVHLDVGLSETLADRSVQDPVAAAVEHADAAAKLNKIDNIRPRVASSQ